MTPVSCSKDDISMVAELEIVKNDLEIERQRVEEQDGQLKDKQRALDLATATLSAKKGEIAELKKKIFEFANEGKAERLRLTAELEAVKADKQDLEDKLGSLERNKQEELEAAINKVEAKAKRRAAHMEELIRARHLKYKAKENAFRLEQQQTRLQLEAFHNTLALLGRQVPQIALALDVFEKKRHDDKGIKPRP